jgi:hypothetical protein
VNREKGRDNGRGNGKDGAVCSAYLVVIAVDAADDGKARSSNLHAYKCDDADVV